MERPKRCDTRYSSVLRDAVSVGYAARTSYPRLLIFHSGEGEKATVSRNMNAATNAMQEPVP